MRIILLRGLGRDRLHWKPLFVELKKKWPDALVESPDLPGAGVRHYVKSPIDLVDYIPWLEEQLVDNDEPATVIGLSLGGMVGLKWAELCPDKFKHVVMINSSSRLSWFYTRLKVLRAIQHPSILWRWNLRAKERATYHLTCNHRPMPVELLNEWVEIQRKHPVTVSNQVRQVLAALTYRLPVKSSVPPVHIVYSDADKFVDPSCSIALAKHYNSKTYTHPWAGHDLSQDDPAWLVSTLEKIIKD